MKRNNLLCGAVLLGITLFCTSCMVGRRQIKSPDLKLPSEIVQGKADSLTLADLAWWNIYTDSTLTALIERTLAYNKDLLMASARVQRMQALSRSAKADRLPSITGSMYAETEHNDYKGSPATDDPEIGAKARLAWELDLWGNPDDTAPVKTIYDPCPKGYMVAPAKVFSGFTVDGQNAWIDSSILYEGSFEDGFTFTNASSFFPAAGQLANNSGVLRLVPGPSGREGYYWTSSVGEDGDSRMVDFNKSMLLYNTNKRASGCSVRCVRVL